MSRPVLEFEPAPFYNRLDESNVSFKALEPRVSCCQCNFGSLFKTSWRVFKARPYGFAGLLLTNLIAYVGSFMALKCVIGRHHTEKYDSFIAVGLQFIFFFLQYGFLNFTLDILKGGTHAVNARQKGWFQAFVKDGFQRNYFALHLVTLLPSICSALLVFFFFPEDERLHGHHGHHHEDHSGSDDNVQPAFSHDSHHHSKNDEDERRPPLLAAAGVLFCSLLSFSFMFAKVVYVNRSHSLCIGKTLKASFKGTWFNLGTLILFGLYSFVLVLAGVLMLGVGLFITLPMIAISYVLLYARIYGLSDIPSTASSGSYLQSSSSSSSRGMTIVDGTIVPTSIHDEFDEKDAEYGASDPLTLGTEDSSEHAQYDRL